MTISKDFWENPALVREYLASQFKTQNAMNDFAAERAALAAHRAFVSEGMAQTTDDDPELKWVEFYPGDRLALLNAARDAARSDLGREDPERVAEYFTGYLRILRGF